MVSGIAGIGQIEQIWEDWSDLQLGGQIVMGTMHRYRISYVMEAVSEV